MKHWLIAVCSLITLLVSACSGTDAGTSSAELAPEGGVASASSATEAVASEASELGIHALGVIACNECLDGCGIICQGRPNPGACQTSCQLNCGATCDIDGNQGCPDADLGVCFDDCAVQCLTSPTSKSCYNRCTRSCNAVLCG